MTQHDNPITLAEKKTIIKHSFRAKKIPDNYHKLDRAEQVIILRLCTGHNRLNSHMYKTMKLVQSPLCTCHTGDQTADHILQDCPTFTNLRTQIWPDGISLHQQLHGTTEDLGELLASFSKLDYLCNQANEKKKKKKKRSILVFI